MIDPTDLLLCEFQIGKPEYANFIELYLPSQPSWQNTVQAAVMDLIQYLGASHVFIRDYRGHIVVEYSVTP